MGLCLIVRSHQQVNASKHQVDKSYAATKLKDEFPLASCSLVEQFKRYSRICGPTDFPFNPIRNGQGGSKGQPILLNLSGCRFKVI